MDEQTKRQQLKELCEFWYAEPWEFTGMTYRECLEDVERNYPAAVIFWGCWTESDLDTVLVSED